MTSTPLAARVSTPATADRRRWTTRALRSGWPPVALLAAVAAMFLRHYGVSPRETAVFATFVILGCTVPGVLLWRACRGGSRFAAEEMAAGTALGHVITVLTYVPARWTGHPLFVLASPVMVITVFLVVPRLRRYWRRTGDITRVPLACSWGGAALVGFVVLSTASGFFRQHGLTSPGYLRPYVDLPFHLGLVGELKHHMPPTQPFVSGEPLYYHWFAYADMAAISWVTGIEPQTLLYRLFILAASATSLMLFFAIARRLTERWWAGPAALAIGCLAWGPGMYSWEPSLWAGLLLRDDIAWRSPTHGFGMMLFAAVVLLLVDLLRRQRPGVAPWALLVLLLLGVMGAKATILPLLLAGLLVVVAGGLIAGRRPHRTAVMAALATLPCLLFAQLVLFGGTSDGMVVHPWSLFGTVGAEAASTPRPTAVLVIAVALVTMFGRGCAWVGALSLAFRRQTLCDPPVLLLAGIGGAGIAVAITLRFAGDSQIYFLHGAAPYLSVVAVCGLRAMLPERVDRRSLIALMVAAAVGVAVITMVGEAGGASRPTPEDAVRRVIGPFMLLIASGGVCAVGLVLAGRRRPGLRSLSPALALAFVCGLVLPATLLHARQMVRGLPLDPSTAVIGAGTLEAGRWLRDHSRPDDLVATNSLCGSGDGCDERHFAVAAYTERRVLVESWRFTARNHSIAARRGLPDGSVPFWDRPRLAANDAAFHHPSAEALRRLHDTYGVRWLFADASRDRPAAGLERFARLRYTAGDCRVYELTN
ncbi:DUF2298 domain-containing protein [Actinoallomurus spadix]|uniref:DUF2298 domain-containing protein n=1 Tax=Actinoallomurus spadix TaxID=79912 RepID=UPI002093E2BA|nr:DUF2298 domain-containing protein [Actinoallomurus spadix]MCO5989118.1 DUF2298 domain-containing protein [Actinoallomurus spadix]